MKSLIIVDLILNVDDSVYGWLFCKVT